MSEIVSIILQVLSLAFIIVGSMIGLGTIIVGHDVYGPIATTYLSYSSIVRNIILTLFGAILMSSVLIVRSSRLDNLRTITGLFFLGLIVVNLFRLVTLPPDWGTWDSGFETVMLPQFEIGTALSFIVLLVGLLVYCLSLKSELRERGFYWYLSIATAIMWSLVLVIVTYNILTSTTPSLGQGWSGLILYMWIFSLLPMAFTFILIISNALQSQDKDETRIMDQK
ncbi:MAG: hypothetical protein RTU30_11355 [Candidatus Thorarchaeota archaeon]